MCLSILEECHRVGQNIIYFSEMYVPRDVLTNTIVLVVSVFLHSSVQLETNLATLSCLGNNNNNSKELAVWNFTGRFS